MSFKSLVLEAKLTAAESIVEWLNRIAARVASHRRKALTASRQKEEPLQTRKNSRPKRGG